MTGKERVLAAVCMQRTDRTPCDFHACGAVLQRLYAHFGVNTYRELLGRLRSDIVDIRGLVDPEWVAPFPKAAAREDGSVVDYLGFCKKVQQTVFGPVEEHSDYILSGCGGLEEIKAFRFPRVEWFDFSAMGGRLDEYGEYAVMASGASVFQHPTLVRGMDQFLCDMVAEPEIAEYLVDGYVNFYLDYYDAMLAACKGKIDILRIADDLGMQDRPLISVELFERRLLGKIKKLCDMAHSHGARVMFHSCGSVAEFIGPLMGAGVDIIDPIQPTARGMEPERLYRRFGGKICFHGSIDTQYLLPAGTPEQVRAQVWENIEALGAGGTGFIVAPAHTLQPDVRTENIVALYDEIARCGGAAG